MKILLRSRSFNHRGYIALISTLIISVLLTVLVVTVDESIFFARDSLVGEESYRQAELYARSCGAVALDRLTLNPLRFSGTKEISISIGGITCFITGAVVTGNTARVSVRGEFANSSVSGTYSANRQSSSTPFKLQRWEEQ